MLTRQHVGILAVAFAVPIFVVLACTKRYPTSCSDDPAALDLADLDDANGLAGCG